MCLTGSRGAPGLSGSVRWADVPVSSRPILTLPPVAGIVTANAPTVDTKHSSTGSKGSPASPTPVGPTPRRSRTETIAVSTCQAPTSTIMPWSRCNMTVGWSPRFSSRSSGRGPRIRRRSRSSATAAGSGWSVTRARSTSWKTTVMPAAPCASQIPTGPRPITVRTGQLVRRMARFLRGEPPPVGVAEGVASLRLVQAALDSLHNGGHVVELDGQRQGIVA
jgi:hypothetical protein